MNLFDFFLSQSFVKHPDGTKGIPGFTGTTGLDDYTEAQVLANMYKDTCLFGNDPTRNRDANGNSLYDYTGLNNN